jgi:glycosyltransferase involved in cell wall biosynthesis
VGLIIHAPNVHQGGGKSLLVALLKALRNETHCKVTLDARLQLPHELSDSVWEIRVKPSILSRLMAEWRLSNLVTENDTVLCFGNLPPLFGNRGRVLLFLQNRYLIGRLSLTGFPFLTKLRIRTERLWLRLRLANVAAIIVQTPSMQHKVLKATGTKSRVLPFSENTLGYERSRVESRSGNAPEYDFVYVASGEPHKNHINLIEAWKLLAKEGLYPSLRLTLPKEQFSGLCSRIGEEKARHRLRIENRPVSLEQVPGLYAKARALIYPSTIESFGLPLIEARNAGLPVIASELDYVRDMIDPEQSFDPSSPVSIARAVRRHLGESEKALPLISAGEFIRQILMPPD